MNIENLLNSALETLSSMSADDFEAACQKAGYRPVKRDDIFQISTTDVVSTILKITYGETQNIHIEGSVKTEFSDSANDLTFVLAA